MDTIAATGWSLDITLLYGPADGGAIEAGVEDWGRTLVVITETGGSAIYLPLPDDPTTAVYVEESYRSAEWLAAQLRKGTR